MRRVALVTGSGQMIGAAIARRLAEAGATVVVNGHRSEENIDRTVADIRDAGGTEIGILADVWTHSCSGSDGHSRSGGYRHLECRPPAQHAVETITVEDGDWAAREQAENIIPVRRWDMCATSPTSATTSAPPAASSTARQSN